MWDALHNYFHSLEPKWWISASLVIALHLLNNFIVSPGLAPISLSTNLVLGCEGGKDYHGDRSTTCFIVLPALCVQRCKEAYRVPVLFQYDGNQYACSRLSMNDFKKESVLISEQRMIIFIL